MDNRKLTSYLTGIVTAVTIGIAFFSKSSWALSDADIKEQIQLALTVRHPHDTGDWWRSLGANAVQVIIGMYAQSSDPYTQIRLIDALAWYSDPQATALLKNEADHNANQVIVDSALRALVKSQGMQEKTYITQVLNGTNVHSRIAVGKALNEMNDAQATALVDQYLSQEKVSWATSKVQTNRSYRSRLLQGNLGSSTAGQGPLPVVRKPQPSLDH